MRSIAGIINESDIDSKVYLTSGRFHVMTFEDKYLVVDHKDGSILGAYEDKNFADSKVKYLNMVDANDLLSPSLWQRMKKIWWASVEVVIPMVAVLGVKYLWDKKFGEKGNTT